MASLRDIRKRIKSVKSTQKITRAMKLVSAAKLKRAQSAILAARPYADSLQRMINRIAASENLKQAESLHPLLTARESRERAMVIVLTSDRGMCGAFNTNVLRRADLFIGEQKSEFVQLDVSTIGKRGRDHFSKKGQAVAQDHQNIYGHVSFLAAQTIARQLTETFLEKQLDAVYLVYNRFVSAMTQTVQVERLLPIIADDSEAVETSFIYEPNQATLLDQLLPRYLSTQIYRALLESVAAEHGARMTAMESATKNASEMIGQLTLAYNRARQAGITKELMEIVAGAEAQR